MALPAQESNGNTLSLVDNRNVRTLG